MDQQMQALFAPLIPVFATRNFQPADIFELIGRFIETNPGVAQAMAFHARDILMETTPPATHSAHVTEIYRRTFFDIEHAQKYGTTEMLENGTKTIQTFVEYLVNSFQMDDIQAAANSGALPPSSQSH